jgi:CheY-like chemotaxis protein
MAASGADAIQLAALQQPDAILLDVSMPNMDGVETLQQLRNDPKTQAIPVIFLTAKVQPAEQAAYQKLGVAGLIIKPFDPIELSRAICQLLNWPSH